MTGPLVLGPEVETAQRDGVPIVALESTIIAHGLPRPRNLEVAGELEELVRLEGACPATIAVLDGEAHVGLRPDELARVASDPELRKLGRRDLPVALAAGASGATTVSATAWLAATAGIRVFSTGGLGGVHRGYSQSFDESADLGVLSSTRITVVSAGVKSILDVAATLERLETLSVTVVGFGTGTFPGFYLHSSGHRVDWRVGTPSQVAEVMCRQDELGISSAILVANPVPEDQQLSPELHDRALAGALEKADREGVTGQRLTPFLLAELVRASEGASLEANLAAVRGNVRLGARIAAAFSALRHQTGQGA
ncbi:MAG TPA: pseudouridine-5'-phosphate glycosidase [Acidimicrobiales bacterium]|nr:pseudouridine-5'-phosphate glycosidase [Acidimicrobiales bacterium]